MAVDISIEGIDNLRSVLNSTLNKVNGRAQIANALAKAAEPIKQQVLNNIDSGGHVRTGYMKRHVAISKLKGGKKYNYYVKVGVIGSGFAYMVEHGHGGPKPAGKHPFVRPAYDARRAEANQILSAEVNKWVTD